VIELNLNRRVPPSSFVPSSGVLSRIHRLLKVLAAKEDELRGSRFLAPCVLGGTVGLRGGGLLYSFRPEPQDFEGWGIFEPEDERTARLVAEASPRRIAEYLEGFKQIRLRLAYRIRGGTWLASPVNEAEARQRLGTSEPQQVYLVNEGAQFDQIVARWDGAVCWFEELDRRADPLHAERLRAALRERTPPASVAWKDCTPEMRGCYVQACERRGTPDTQRHLSDTQRLVEALALDGGELVSFTDEGDCWEVMWKAPASGYTYSSVIEKQDLTVVSSGICLDGRDRDFDLQSLVRVIDGSDCDCW
jgi:hypothetical protein